MPRYLAIGDIHGCLNALQTLVEFVGLREDDMLITLGDYINRGPDSYGVLDWLIQFEKTGRLVALRGNHEVKLLKGRTIESERRRGLARTGPNSRRSQSTLDARPADLTGVQIPRKIPLSQWEFLFEKLVATYETETHFFVHASVDPAVPLDQQPDELLYWKRYQSNFRRHVSGKIMVCGHKVQSSGLPATNGNAICIDTGACKQGWLTCLDVGTGDFWQANMLGATRRSNLAELNNQ